MTYIIVLFNLREGATVMDYENWARAVDLPTVRSIKGCESFDVFRTLGLYTGGDAPYQYVEVIAISDMEAFKKGAQTPEMDQIRETFQGSMAENPIFMLCDKVD